MGPISNETLAARADALLELVASAGIGNSRIFSEAYQGTLSLLLAVYGHRSVQEAQMTQAMARADKSTTSRGNSLQEYVAPAVVGALKALKFDLEHGLTGSVAARASGLELGDLLILGKQALDEGGEGHRNVAAVLVAAAFEDTLRRLAEQKAGVTDRPKLADLVGRLKEAEVLTGASVSAANGYLKFRNDALHADWSKLQEPTIIGCAAFVERLLLDHFS